MAAAVRAMETGSLETVVTSVLPSCSRLRVLRSCVGSWAVWEAAIDAEANSHAAARRAAPRARRFEGQPGGKRAMGALVAASEEWPRFSDYNRDAEGHGVIHLNGPHPEYPA